MRFSLMLSNLQLNEEASLRLRHVFGISVQHLFAYIIVPIVLCASVTSGIFHLPDGGFLSTSVLTT